MKHEWEDPIPKTMSNYLKTPQRRCKNCGVIQELIETTQWMRVVSREWLPKAGRCNPTKRNKP